MFLKFKFLLWLLPLLALFAGSSFAQDKNPDPMFLDVPTTEVVLRDNEYGMRNVSYFVVNDWAIIDGDVIYGTERELLANSIPIGGGNGLNRRAFSKRNGPDTWPSATVTYKYESDATQTLLKPIVDAAILEWKTLAPYLKFKKLALNSAADVNGILNIKALPCGGCVSGIGFSSSIPKGMNLQQGCPTAPWACGVGAAVHEFGHLLGLYHEHQRTNRELTVHYNCANLAPSCPAGSSMPAGKTCCDSGLPAGCCSKKNNFAIISGPASDSSGPYDIGSLMQYPRHAFALPGKYTLTPAPGSGVTVPAANPAHPDARDVERICKLYKGQCPRAKACTAIGCPTPCKIIPKCNNQILCLTDFAPPCCDPEDANAACAAKKTQCTVKNCSFLMG